MKYKCSNCGGLNVDVQMWVAYNRLVDFVQTGDDPTYALDFMATDDFEGWCNDCKEHYKLIEVED